MARVGDDQQVRVGDLRRHFAGVRGRRAQVVGAAEDQRRHVGQRRVVDGRGGRRERPVARSGAMSLSCERVGRGERRERARGQRSRGGARFGDACPGVGRAAPRELLLFAGRRVVQRRVEVFSFRLRRLLERLDQARERRGVAARGRRDRGERIRRAAAARSRRRAAVRAARWRTAATDAPCRRRRSRVRAAARDPSARARARGRRRGWR